MAVNHPGFFKRAEILREKGTNRSAFFRGEVDKYNWVDVGSSFLPSDILAAFLYAQLEHMETIQNKRKMVWDSYYNGLSSLQETGIMKLPKLPDYAINNGHIFYFTCKDVDVRAAYIAYMKANDVQTPFHYVSLHNSPFYIDKHNGAPLPMTEYYTDCLVRLPLFYDITTDEVDTVIN